MTKKQPWPRGAEQKRKAAIDSAEDAQETLAEALRHLRTNEAAAEQALTLSMFYVEQVRRLLTEARTAAGAIDVAEMSIGELAALLWHVQGRLESLNGTGLESTNKSSQPTP